MQWFCKNNSARHWISVKLDPSPCQNPLLDHHQNFTRDDVADTTSMQSIFLPHIITTLRTPFLLGCFWFGGFTQLCTLEPVLHQEKSWMFVFFSKNVTFVVRRVTKYTVVTTCQCLKWMATDQRSIVRTFVCWQSSSSITRRSTTTSSRFISMCWLLLMRPAATSLDTSPRLLRLLL